MRRGMRWEAPSMPTAAYDPDLLREQETLLVIRKNWFLDQEIPAGCFVRIQDSSQVWEERVDETRIITMDGLTTCLDPGRGWTITSGGWNFLKKQECWEGHEQALIATIWKQTKRTAELRTLDTEHQRGQYYKHCSRSIMPRELKERQRYLALLSCSRRDEEIYSEVLREKLRRTNGSNMKEPIKTKKRKVGWKRRARCTTGSCGASQKMGRRKSAHLSSAGKKSSRTMMKRNRKRKKNKKNGSKNKAYRGESVRYWS